MPQRECLECPKAAQDFTKLVTTSKTRKVILLHSLAIFVFSENGCCLFMKSVELIFRYE